MELAEELQKVRLEKDALESRTRALEQALGNQAKDVGLYQGIHQASILTSAIMLPEATVSDVPYLSCIQNLRYMTCHVVGWKGPTQLLCQAFFG